MEEELVRTACAKILVFEQSGVHTKDMNFCVAAGKPGDWLVPALSVHTPVGKQ